MDKLTDFVASKLTEDDKKAFTGGNIPQGGGYPPVSAADDDDLRGAAQDAAKRSGAHGSEDMFNSVLGMLTQKKPQLKDEDDVDEEKFIQSHKKNYEDDDDDEADGSSLGAAAAMQALKMFAGGSSKPEDQPTSQSSSAFVALAMSEASKLFDAKSSQGKVKQETSKESAVMQAGEMALKMYLKSQGGGKQSSSTGLLSMASKFM